MRIFIPVTAALLLITLTDCETPQEERRSAVLMHPAIDRAKARGLVDMRTFLPDVVCDLRYATLQNVTGKRVYPADMPCFLNRGTAEKFKRAQIMLRSQGYGLKIWDAWRPPESQLALFRFGGHTGMFVDPKECWSKHCSGMAVDVTLVDGKGFEMPLPTYFDEASEKAHYHYHGDDPIVKRHIEILQQAMAAAGFTTIPMEWWHFDDSNFNEDAPPPVIYAGEIGVALPDL